MTFRPLLFAVLVFPSAVFAHRLDEYMETPHVFHGLWQLLLLLTGAATNMIDVSR